MNYSIIHKKKYLHHFFDIDIKQWCPWEDKAELSEAAHESRSQLSQWFNNGSIIIGLTFLLMYEYICILYTSIQQLLRSPSFLVVRHHEYHFIWAIFARGSLDFLLAMITVILSTQREDNLWIGDICFCHKTRSDDTHRNGTSVSSHCFAWRKNAAERFPESHLVCQCCWVEGPLWWLVGLLFL